MRNLLIFLAIASAACLLGHGVSAQDGKGKAAVAELLEDNGEALLKLLTNPTGDSGTGHLEQATVFSGKSSVKIIPLQRFHSRIPDWKYRIVEKPGPGEYRYLRFAWKAVGAAGIMIQLHDEKDWYIRYTAGNNTHGWTSKFVADQPPCEWTVVTCDLFKDFGERTLTGMALTVFNGQAGYFDHIYLGRTIDDLDRIDATGLRQGKPIALAPADLDRLWNELAGKDAAKAYLAFWTLVAAPKNSLPFLQEKLRGAKGAVGAKQIRQWITELDDNKFAVREKAFKELTKHLEAAAELLEQEQQRNISAEASRRIEQLLAGRRIVLSDRAHKEKGLRVLEYAGSPEAIKSLQELAKTDGSAWLTEAAAATVRRMEARSAK